MNTSRVLGYDSEITSFDLDGALTSLVSSSLPETIHETRLFSCFLRFYEGSKMNLISFLLHSHSSCSFSPLSLFLSLILFTSSTITVTTHISWNSTLSDNFHTFSSSSTLYIHSTGCYLYWQQFLLRCFWSFCYVSFITWTLQVESSEEKVDTHFLSLMVVKMPFDTRLDQQMNTSVWYKPIFPIHWTSFWYVGHRFDTLDIVLIRWTLDVS